MRRYASAVLAVL